MNRLTRTAYVDIAKGMAILSVVLLHVDFAYPQWPLLDISAMLGWYWHVPVFFLIGGFFLKDERLAQPVSFIKGKFRSLYLLALYIYLPATLLHNCLLWMGWYSTDVVYGGKVMADWGVKEYLWGILKTLLCAGREPVLGAMWFIYALLFALCGYSMVYWFVNKCKSGGVLRSRRTACLADNLLHHDKCVWDYHSAIQQCCFCHVAVVRRATGEWQAENPV